MRLNYYFSIIIMMMVMITLFPPKFEDYHIGKGKHQRKSNTNNHIRVPTYNIPRILYVSERILIVQHIIRYVKIYTWPEDYSASIKLR